MTADLEVDIGDLTFESKNDGSVVVTAIDVVLANGKFSLPTQ